MEEVAVTGSSFDLTGAIHIMDPLSCQPGSHADLYLAKWKGSIVCAKVLRYIGRPSDEEARRALDTQAKREFAVWSSLKHPNVLPILGFCVGFGPSLTFISPLISGGCAPEYLRAHPFVDRLKLVSEIGEGLSYIHGKDIIHGDLKGANILVTGPPNRPVPLICDFGLSKSSNATDSTSGPCGTLGWMAIELLSAPDDACMPTFASDMWSWGMTVLMLVSST
ncbi:hypothetical protein NLI96_g3333 [Meripilus lineatus]|uniref:Protein kinase domain-containing protein n=1 Tax=Meripilus lineatus TaxID=2056292 RepID=A0AAD5YL41_9APHY|nr:hypothetical protein NLI96_g3333 [Physisporinus lineatus]